MIWMKSSPQWNGRDWGAAVIGKSGRRGEWNMFWSLGPTRYPTRQMADLIADANIPLSRRQEQHKK